MLFFMHVFSFTHVLIHVVLLLLLEPLCLLRVSEAIMNDLMVTYQLVLALLIIIHQNSFAHFVLLYLIKKLPCNYIKHFA